MTAPRPPGSALGDDDLRFLERAVALGRRGWGGVYHNPMVGCVLVRDGRIVGEGWHEEFGGPHAETRALERAGAEAEGATAYVSLEPCRHEGKTPACTRALITSGVARVVFGAPDPGPESGGGGADLVAAGIEVVGPVFGADRAWSLNPAFFQWHRTQRPFVALKLAVSLDGALAAAPGERTQLTGPPAAAETHRLRTGFDAVMVGSGTALADDPLLTVREAPLRRSPPVRIVLDSRARLPTHAALFRSVPDVPLWVFCREDAPELDIARLEGAGARVHPVPASPSNGRPPPTSPGLDVDRVLEICGELGLRSVLCEGGAVLGDHLLHGGWARRLYLFVAPRVLGGEAVPAFPRPLPGGWRRVDEPVGLGDDTLITLDRLD